MTCNLCGSASSEVLFYLPDSNGRPPWPLRRCLECGLGYLSPRPTPEELIDYYSPEYYGPRSGRFVRPVEAFEVWCRKRRAREIARLRPPGRILDIGCGRGIMLDELRRRGWSVTGTEASETAARHARDVLGLPVATQDVQELGLREGSLDVVTLYHVLDHLPDARGCLQEVHRALKPGGLLVVAVPNLDSLGARWTGQGWFRLDPPRHQFHFSKESLLLMLEELRFEPVRVKRFSLEHGPYGMLQSLLNRMGFPHDFLHNSLKRPEARLRNGTPRGWRVLIGIAHVLALPALAPVSFALHALDALLGGGSCIEVHAMRRCGPARKTPPPRSRLVA